MRIRKCDRCGGTYEPYESKFNTVGIVTFNMDDEDVSGTTFYDLCPHCRQEFVSWMETHGAKVS